MLWSFGMYHNSVNVHTHSNKLGVRESFDSSFQMYQPVACKHILQMSLQLLLSSRLDQRPDVPAFIQVDLDMEEDTTTWFQTLGLDHTRCSSVNWGIL